MQWHDLIFSNQATHRNKRHLFFWLAWWLFIIVMIFFPPGLPVVKNANPIFQQYQTGLNQLGYFAFSLLVLVKSLFLVLIHMCFCYTIISVLLPYLKSRKNYLLFILGIMVAGTIMIPLSYFLYFIVYPFIDNLFSLQSIPYKFMAWRSIDAGLIFAIKVTLIAVALTLLKSWWLKQQEKEKLEKEKINAELQLLKAQIHPAFLFSTLNNIISHSRIASPRAPEMLIKLSDLLSYMLYECDSPKVRLEKELGVIREYMALEKICHDEKLEMTVQINGDINGQMISPLLLLPFIDHSLSYCNHERIDQAWINLEITVDNTTLNLKLINGMPPGIPYETGQGLHSLTNVQKRLELLYPGRYELKINALEELVMVQLSLILEEDVQTDPSSVYIAKPPLLYAGT